MLNLIDKQNKLTILLFISWKCISHTLSTTSSLWNVTNPKPVIEKSREEKKYNNINSIENIIRVEKILIWCMSGLIYCYNEKALVWLQCQL